MVIVSESAALLAAFRRDETRDQVRKKARHIVDHCLNDFED